MDFIHRFTKLADLQADIFHLFPCGAVGQAQQKLDAVLLPPGIIDDRRVAQQGIGNKHQLLIKGPYAGAAEGDQFHDTFHIVSGDPVAFYERALRDDDDASENVGQ